MKKQLQSILFVALLPISLVLTKNDAFAQGDAAQLIKAGAADATILAEAYLNPLFKGIGFGMNSGWYNSAKTKNLGRFDLRIQATGALVPTADRSFDIKSLNLSDRVRLSNPNGSGITPTAFGDDTDGPEIVVRDNVNGTEVELTRFRMPQGSGFNIVPSPQIQLTVGLIMNTDVSVRFAPEVGSDDFGKISSWGVGIKKELTSFLPGKKIIPFDLSVAFGYNQINYKYEVPAEDQINESNIPRNDLNQRLDAKFSGFTIDAILSKKLAIFTPFVSVGYNTAKTELGILGKYNIQQDVDISDPQNPSIIYGDVVDPVKIDHKSISGMRANVGFALHLAVFRLYGAYSIGEYQAVTAGIGLGIGK